jgi:hypothetical protein
MSVTKKITNVKNSIDLLFVENKIPPHVKEKFEEIGTYAPKLRLNRLIQYHRQLSKALGINMVATRSRAIARSRRGGHYYRCSTRKSSKKKKRSRNVRI